MSDAPLLVRHVRPEELEPVGDLTYRAYVEGNGTSPDSPYAAHLRRAAERAAAAPLLVAIRGGELVGAVSLCPYGTQWCEIAQPGEVELRMLVVDPAVFGTGVGDSLVGACLERAAALEADRVVLSVIDDNGFAHRLYERHGFTRDPARDWTPVPGVELLGYAVEVSTPNGSAASG